jgi:GYF domain 2
MGYHPNRGATVNLTRRFYLARNNQKHGPYPFEQFKQLAATGLVLPTDMVLEEGQSKWQQASSVEGLWPEPEKHEEPPRTELHLPSGRPPLISRSCLVVFLVLILFCAGFRGLVYYSDRSAIAEKEAEEAEAKVKLIAVLDSWLLRESRETFKRRHPDIEENVVGKDVYVLLKYEILTAGNKDIIFGYRFAVMLIYQSQAGTEIKKNSTFDVNKSPTGWRVGSMGE